MGGGLVTICFSPGQNWELLGAECLLPVTAVDGSMAAGGSLLLSHG